MGHSLFPRPILPRPLRKPSAFIVETAHFSCFVLTFLGLFPHCRDLWKDLTFSRQVAITTTSPTASASKREPSTNPPMDQHPSPWDEQLLHCFCNLILTPNNSRYPRDWECDSSRGRGHHEVGPNWASESGRWTPEINTAVSGARSVEFRDDSFHPIYRAVEIWIAWNVMKVPMASLDSHCFKITAQPFDHLDPLWIEILAKSNCPILVD
eukprot:m.164986 g.164986  ORF g.164986 m.164986 type:complete len:210 (+) comp14664_c0_seq3:7407-8036(+)